MESSVLLEITAFSEPKTDNKSISVAVRTHPLFSELSQEGRMIVLLAIIQSVANSLFTGPTETIKFQEPSKGNGTNN